jgi:hypothetical protein
MADSEVQQQGDLKYYQNQPYDLEVDIKNDDDDVDAQRELKGQLDQDDQQEQNYQEVKVSPPQIKALPKFDISKFEELNASPEAKDLLNIMKS